MPPISAILIIGSSGIIFSLGLAHLLITFRGRALWPRSPALRDAMRDETLKISGETTVWRAWIGFNASHSLGALMFGAIYAYLALCQLTLLRESMFLQGVGLLFLLSFVLLAHRYWFSLPFRGILLASLLYIAALARMWQT